MRRCAALVLVILVLPAFGGDKADPGKELKKLDGTWEVAGLEVDGKAIPREQSPKTLVIAGGKLTGLGPEMELALDPGKKPKWIDLTFKKDDKAYPIRAIYQLTGDELHLAIPMAAVGKAFENQRPADFTTKGKQVMVLKAKRAAPAKK